MEGLTQHIQGLPQELQDEILGHVVRPQTNGVVEVITSYKPPVGLQINRKIRDKSAHDFYGTNIFSMMDFQFEWIWSLPTAHLNTIYEFRTAISGYDFFSPPNSSENVMKRDTCGVYRGYFVDYIKIGHDINLDPRRFSVAFREARSGIWYFPTRESLTMVKTGPNTFDFESSRA